jgi:hypothetical protein
MQAALHDLTPTRETNPRPFLICQRVLHRCHEIIFGDPPEPSRSPYRSLPHSPPNSSAALSASKSMRSFLGVGSRDEVIRSPVRVNPHAAPSFVGMGVIIASMGMPGLKNTAGEWAVLQGRKTWDEDAETRARVEVEQGGGADAPRKGMGLKSARPRGGSSSDEDDIPKNGPQSAPLRGEPSSIPHPASTLPNLSPGPSIAEPGSSSLILTSPSLKGDDPFSQSAASAGPSTPPAYLASYPRHAPSSSVPELATSSQGHQASALRRLNPQDRTTNPESLLATYSLDAQRQLLRSHYCRSEVRFLLLLEDISNRLLVIPKLARVSALRAELTSLNHNLPAEVSFWSSTFHRADGRSVCHCGVPLTIHTRREVKPQNRVPLRLELE